MNMKKIQLITFSLLTAILMGGCGNDWMDIQPSTEIETEGSLTELRDFEFVLNGAYSGMQSSSYYGATMMCYGDLTGDDMKCYKSSSTNVSYYTFKYNKTNGPSGFWSVYYGIAKNLNILLRDIDRIELVPDRVIITPKMEKLTEQVSINQKKERELENKKKDLDKLLEKRQKAIEALNEEKNSIKMKAESKIERLVDQRIAEINKIWESKQGKGDLSYSQISQAKGELKKIKIDDEPSLSAVGKVVELTDLKAGEKVEDEDGRVGTVMEVKKKEVLLDMDGLRIRRKIAGLKRAKLTAKDVKVKKENYASIDSAILNLGPSQGLEVNIIGLHVDEAMRKVVSFLDSARIHRYTPVRIIHGAGTFALKNAVWKYLSNHKEFVKDYRLGGEGEGGLGATVVYLK